MADRDFGSDLDALPSLSQLNGWLTEDFGREMPSPVAEEPAICPSLLSATPSATPVPPSACPSVSATSIPIFSRRSTSECESSKKIINIEYIFWTPEIKDKPPATRSTYKRKAPPNSEEPKFIKLPSEKGKIYIRWEVENLSFLDFKQYAFQAIRNQDAPELGDNAAQLDKNGLITWEVSVPHGGAFAAKNKASINNDRVFSDFVEVISVPGEEGRKVIVTLIEKDPNAVAQKNKALKHLKKLRDAPADDDSPPVPSMGGAHSAEIVANIREIRAQNPPCERLTGSHEIPVFINPKNNKEFIRITVDRVTLWAIAMTKNPDITTSNPPQSPAFTFETRAEARVPQSDCRTSASGGISTPPKDFHPTPAALGQSSPPYPLPVGNFWYYPYQHAMPYFPGYGPPGAHPIPPSTQSMNPPSLFGGFGQTTQAGIPPNPAHPPGGTGVPSSPAASEGVEIEEYLNFAHVDPADLVIQRALDDLGITHYSAFRNFKPCELEDAGIKKGHARSLICSLSRFERHLKTRQPQ